MTPATRPGFFRRAACALGLIGFSLAAIGSLVAVLGSDRTHTTQYLAWIPSWCWLLAGAAGLTLWSLAAPNRREPVRRSPRGIAWVIWSLALLGVLMLEWRWYRLVLPSPSANNPLRVLVWNLTYTKLSNAHTRVLDSSPDLILLADPNPSMDWQALRQGMGGTTYAVRARTLVAVSRYPIRRFASIPLDIAPEPNRPAWWPVQAGSSAGGEALCLCLDVPGYDSEFVIWYLDLPSDAWINRRRMMTEAAAAIANFRGPFLRRTDDGRDIPDHTLRWGHTLDGGGLDAVPDPSAPIGFPPPDLLAGDLNTPRGSWSLSILAPGLGDAASQAAIGPIGTFPRVLPVVHIDQALLGPRCRAINYDTAAPGATPHMAQIVDVEAAR